ncbi:phosphatase PAP2 family protein [Streptomyces sp. NBC_01217]|uniref:phosphatase PAP2 family protein n=1 Tax=Streptomyces sp. NBC_01217 TaxID=2903779 RepID=UPI002E143175|nr:phosphatase PAP2 family protein [Streptomyces sp. NBC_01217]
MPSLTSAPPARPRSRVTLFGASVVCAAAALALLVLVAVRWLPLMTLDRTVAQALHRRAVTEPGLVHANRILTDWAWDPWTMRALTLVAVVVLWWRGARALAVWAAAVSLLSTLLQQGLKAAVGRERPHWPDPVDSAHFSAFPSGHAMTATVTCGLLLWLLRRRGTGPWMWWSALVVAGVSVVGVGITRLYLGVHWLSDVLGGWLLGAALVGFAVAGFARYEGRGGPVLPQRS